MHMNLQFIWTGISIAYFSGNLTPIMVLNLKSTDYSEKHKDALALYGMIGFGVGDVLGGVDTGLLIDRIGPKYTCLTNMASVVLLTSATVLNVSQAEYNVWTYIMCFLWGFQDGSLNTHTFNLCGF